MRGIEMINIFKGRHRDPNRIKPIIEKLEEVWMLYPDIRLGQLIVICAQAGDIFGIEDDKMLEGIEKYINLKTCSDVSSSSGTASSNTLTAKSSMVERM